MASDVNNLSSTPRARKKSIQSKPVVDMPLATCLIVCVCVCVCVCACVCACVCVCVCVCECVCVCGVSSIDMYNNDVGKESAQNL